MVTRAHELYDKLLNIYKTQYDKLTKAQRKRIKVQNVPENLPIDLYIDEDDLPAMPALEGNDEVKLEQQKTIAVRVKLNSRKKKRRNRIKILTPNKLLTRLPILLAQIEARNNYNKLKNEIRQILYLLYLHNKITKDIYNKFSH